jgi:hypothetical protein
MLLFSSLAGNSFWLFVFAASLVGIKTGTWIHEKQRKKHNKWQP